MAPGIDNANGTLRERDVEKQHNEDGDQKNDSSSEEKSTPPSSASFSDRIAHFTWPWFATTMSTGSVAVVLANTPNRFPGLQTIGKIFFILDLVLFVAFTILMSLRAFWYPKRFRMSLHYPVEAIFFGTYGVSVALILNASQSYGVPACGPWLVTALRVTFWIYLALSLIVAIAQYYTFFQSERLSIPDAVPAWIFPIYPLIVIGPLAATLIPSQPHAEQVDMWVGAVMLQGLAWMVAFMQYTLVMQRLMTSALPAPAARPGMYVAVGPAGYTSAAFIQLGMQAQKIFPGNAFGVSSVPVGDILLIIGVVSGLFVILFAFWFSCVATTAVVMGARKMSFSLNWWAVSLTLIFCLPCPSVHADSLSSSFLMQV